MKGNRTRSSFGSGVCLMGYAGAALGIWCLAGAAHAAGWVKGLAEHSVGCFDERSQMGYGRGGRHRGKEAGLVWSVSTGPNRWPFLYKAIAYSEFNRYQGCPKMKDPEIFDTVTQYAANSFWVLGHVTPGPGVRPLSYELVSRSWAGITWRYTFEKEAVVSGGEAQAKAGGSPLEFVFHCSRLVPYVWMETEGGQVGLFGGLQEWGLGQPTQVAFAGDKGVVIKGTSAVGSGGGVVFQGQEMAECWVLAWFHGAEGWTDRDFDCPMLITLEKRPRAVSLSVDGLMLDFGGTRSGRVSLLPLFGIRKSDMAEYRFRQEQSAAWSQGIPEEVQQRIRQWAAYTRAMPKACQEYYWVDRKRDLWGLKNEFVYETVQDDWGTKPAYYAPVPPWLGLALEVAAEDGLSLKLSGAVTDFKLLGNNGPVCGVDGARGFEVRASGLLQYVYEDRVGPRFEELGLEPQRIGLEGDWLFRPDAECAGLEQKWWLPATSTREWGKMRVPACWEDEGMTGTGKASRPDARYPGLELSPDDTPYNGLAWYRRQVVVPKSWEKARAVYLEFGAVDDFDWTYVNGREVGHTDSTTRPEDYWKAPRRYPVPVEALNVDGENTIVVAVYDLKGKGGICTGPVRLVAEFSQNPDVTWAARQLQEVIGCRLRDPMTENPGGAPGEAYVTGTTRTVNNDGAWGAALAGCLPYVNATLRRRLQWRLQHYIDEYLLDPSRYQEYTGADARQPFLFRHEPGDFGTAAEVLNANVLWALGEYERHTEDRSLVDSAWDLVERLPRVLGYRHDWAMGIGSYHEYLSTLQLTNAEIAGAAAMARLAARRGRSDLELLYAGHALKLLLAKYSQWKYVRFVRENHGIPDEFTRPRRPFYLGNASEHVSWVDCDEGGPWLGLSSLQFYFMNEQTFRFFRDYLRAETETWLKEIDCNEFVCPHTRDTVFGYVYSLNPGLFMARAEILGLSSDKLRKYFTPMLGMKNSWQYLWNLQALIRSGSEAKGR